MNLKDGEFIVSLNGVDHWVKIEGSENETPPLIMIHGGPGGNHYVFERTAGPLLAKARTVVYYEQRGSGRSQKPKSDRDYSINLLVKDFIELKKWLGMEKVDLLGYSFGGELALEISNAIPAEINQLILSAPSLIYSEIDKMVKITGFMSIANTSQSNDIKMLLQEKLDIGEVLTGIWELVGPETVDKLLFENQIIARKNRQLWEESNLINTGKMIEALQSNPVEVPLTKRLNEINHHTLILTGAFDRNTGLPIAKILHTNLKNSSLVVFNKSAHFPDLEETDKFVDVINDFLKA
ncbi:alpha/beta fold hydrolase [Bacillus spongiae]|uniref:Alpha/beta fold hydrolase n=1 Tax=Bacillus spongiae TaxID=2683610 RepID=A0ABU8H9J0_9BACI